MCVRGGECHDIPCPKVYQGSCHAQQCRNNQQNFIKTFIVNDVCFADIMRTERRKNEMESRKPYLTEARDGK